MQTTEVRELSRRIRDSIESGAPVSDRLATSQRIIARVTDGIYREPWAAFRELIANAYDADATRVVVETGAPDFRQVTVRDDGNGMSAETLAYVVKNIGGSSKRTTAGEELHTTRHGEPDRSPGGRQLIGKIGIGLFAVAQLTQHFQIITKAKGEDVRTSATIKLRTHDDERPSDSSGDDEERFVAGKVEFVTERVPSNEIDSHGTAIVLYSLRSEIRRSLQSVDRWAATRELGEDGKPLQLPPTYGVGLLPQLLPALPEGAVPKLPWLASDTPLARFEKLVVAAADSEGRGSKQANLDHFDEYLRLLWQLSLSLPLPYVGQHPFSLDGSSGLLYFGLVPGEKQAVSLNLGPTETVREHLSLTAGASDPAGGFTVLVDDVDLKRPIDLPKSLRERSRIPAPVMLAARVGPAFRGVELERAGGQLSFEAYLYWNSKIVPKDNAGVIVRVREASGTLFDRDFLRYQVSEHSRLRQITAEIFVTEGLDAAINIDRESFNYSHPHFIYIQKWLHRALRLLVNRLKAIAEEDLQRSKVAKAEEMQRTVISSAVNVWSRRRGEAADPPIRQPQSLSAPIAIGGTEVLLDTTKEPDARMIAVGVVLESYGVLSSLSADDRSQIIIDLLEVLDNQK